MRTPTQHHMKSPDYFDKVAYILLSFTLWLACGISVSAMANSETHISATNSSHSSYYVIAEHGLTVRSAPDASSRKVYKLAYGQKVEVLSKTKKAITLMDTHKGITSALTGQWVKVDLSDDESLMHSRYMRYEDNTLPKASTGYVFSGYLESALSFEVSIKKKLHQFPSLRMYQLATQANAFHFSADIFADGIDDDVIKAKALNGETHIIFINNTKTKPSFNILNDPRSKTNEPADYSWDGYFQRIFKHTVLFSNYTDDFRTLAQVPENERVILNHDALLVHAQESCGGAFIFWKDGKFNWLQQE